MTTAERERGNGSSRAEASGQEGERHPPRAVNIGAPRTSGREEPAEVLLEVKDLQVRFELPDGPLDVVDGISFSLQKNEILCVVGESGSGKTVMTHAILGLLTVAPGVIGGEIITNVNGQPTNLLAGVTDYVCKGRRFGREVVKKRSGWNRLYSRRTRTLMGHHLGLIFQNPRNSLDPLMTAGQQIVESVNFAQDEGSPEAARAEAIEWLERVHIDRASEVFDLYPHQLSGGMCQRVAIAQILALRPDILIADEPTTGLDATIQVGILDLMREVQRELGISVLLITHDFGVVERLADRILVLFRGRLLEQGEADEILLPEARLHPYTADLLRNVRVLEGAGGVEQIEKVARAAQRPRPPRVEGVCGCNYASSCPILGRSGPELSAKCLEVDPRLMPLSSSHFVRCHEAPRLVPEEI